MIFITPPDSRAEVFSVSVLASHEAVWHGMAGRGLAVLGVSVLGTAWRASMPCWKPHRAEDAYQDAQEKGQPLAGCLFFDVRAMMDGQTSVLDMLYIGGCGYL